MPTEKVFIAHISGVRYEVFGVGSTEDEAKRAVAREYRRTHNSGYGLLRDLDGREVRTVKQLEDYCGIGVYGPMPIPGAVTQ